MKTITEREYYINGINKLLEDCVDMNIIYFVYSFLANKISDKE